MRLKILFVFNILIAERLFALHTFASAVGGTNIELGYSVIRTSDNGFAVAGMTESFGVGSQDLFFVKFDSLGNVQRALTIGGADQDEAYSLVQSPDGGYVLLGRTKSFGSGNEDIFLVKITQNGELEWARAIGEMGSDVGRSIDLTCDGGFVITGWTGSYSGGVYDFFIIKFNSLGIVEWGKTVSGVENELGYSIIQTSDMGFAIVGVYGADFYVSDTTDCFLAKFDSVGTLEWLKVMGDVYDDRGISVAQKEDGGFIIVGMYDYQRADPNSGDVIVISTGPDGNIDWAKTFDGAGNDKGSFVYVNADGEILVAGKTSSFGAGWSDLLLMKLDADANLIWAKAIGEAGYEEAFSIAQVSEELCVITGETRSFGSGWVDLFIVEFSLTGYSCIGQYINPELTDVNLVSTEIAPAVSVIAPTITKVIPVINNVTPVVTIACEGDKVEETISSILAPSISVSPSIFSLFCVISAPAGAEVSIYDVSGKKIDEFSSCNGLNNPDQGNLSCREIIWRPDVSLPSGIYLIKGKLGSYVITKQVILVR